MNPWSITKGFIRLLLRLFGLWKKEESGAENTRQSQTKERFMANAKKTKEVVDYHESKRNGGKTQ